MTPANGTRVAEQVHEIPLKDILIDHAWNARGKEWLAEVCAPDQSIGGEETDRGLSGLIDSIKSRRHNPVTHGQDDPVVVRPNPDKKTASKFPYALVAGYRRSEAIRRISEEEGEKNPTIRAFIREMTEPEARAANLRENVVRKNLSGANLAWGFARLTLDCGMSPQQAAAELNMQQSYASQLYKIVTKVKGSATVQVKDEDGKTKNQRMPILDAWRHQIVSKSKDDMLKLAEVEDPAKQEQLFTKEKKKGKTGPGAWVDSAMKRAEDQGYLLGYLQHEGHIKADGIRFDKCIHLLVPSIKEDAKPAQLAKIIEAAKDGFKEGKKGLPAEAEAEPVQAAAN